jgi:hypothetical protein
MVKIIKLRKEKRIASLPVVILHVTLLLTLLLLLLPVDFIQNTILGAVLAQVRILGAFAPTFDYNLTNHTINQTDTFYLDVNCSDVDVLDSITYYDNFTGFEINSTTGIINQSGFSQSFVGNHSIRITCGDLFGHNTTQNFTLTILDINEPPVLASIGNQILESSVRFTLNVDATDPENNDLTFGAVTSLFVINPVTGVINFTPTEAQIGNHTVNITVFDGELYDYEVVLFTIVQGPFCGDGSCGNGESCVTCPTDCGTCPTSPGGGETSESQETTESGKGGTATTTAKQVTTPPPPAQAPYYRCDEKWECSAWDVCTLLGTHARKCKDINKCGTTYNKPKEVEECEYVPTCEDGIQNGGETGVDCGGPCRPCLIENCFDGIQNGDEEGIDCGGSCEKTCEAKQAKVPALEIPGLIQLPRAFPWLFLLFIAILLSIMLASDRIYLHVLLKKKLDEYTRLRREYAPWRRKLYKAMLNTIILSLITSAYLYYYSNDYQGMLHNVWILLLVIAIIPFIVSYAIQKYRYIEYEKQRKEKRFKQTHRREVLHFIKIENEFLKDMEKQSNVELYEGTTNHAFDSIPQLYPFFSEFYSGCTNIMKKRRERAAELQMDSSTLEKVNILTQNKSLKKHAKDYPEFYSLRLVLDYLQQNPSADVTDKEQELLDEVEEISKPHIRAVILADPELVKAYNGFVDLYNEYRKKQEQLYSIDLKLYDLERAFTDKVKELTKKSEFMQLISKSAPLAALYNNVVTLFNHYSKKQQLKKALEGI